MTILLLLLLTTLPHDGLLRESFDCLEINHVFSKCDDDTYTYQFTQLLFLNWDEQHGTHVIEAWRMQRSSVGEPQNSGPPQFDHAKRRWELRFDNRVITAQAFRETSADFDWEVRDRDRLPANRRRELRSVPEKRRHLPALP